MRFDCERVRQHGGQIDPDLLFQLQMLEKRHAEVVAERERELTLIQDRAILLAAEQGSQVEALERLYELLATHIDQHASRYAGNPEVRALGQQLARSRAVLSVASQRAHR